MGVRAIGEEAGEQHAFVGKFVEMGRDVASSPEGPDMLARKALHQDEHHMANGQHPVSGRQVVPAHGRLLLIDEGIFIGEQHPAHDGGCLRLRKGCLPDIVPVARHLCHCGRAQGNGGIEAQLVGEHRIGRVGISPAQGRPLPERAARSHQRHHQADGQDRQAHKPHIEHAPSAHLASRFRHSGQEIEPLEYLSHQPGRDCPCQQVAQDGKTEPDHAEHRLRVFLHVLEHQPIQALVEFPVKIEFHDAEEQGGTGKQGQPDRHPAT